MVKHSHWLAFLGIALGWLLVGSIAPANSVEQLFAESAQANDETLLALYILAFDNALLSPANLTLQYQPTLEALAAGTRHQPHKRAVLLVDLDGLNDTHILMLHDGQITPVAGLPDADGQLDTTLKEYDLSDGPSLGQFIRWSRQSYPATQTTLSFIGHGAPLTPETALENFFQTATQRGIPLPSHRGLYANFTDHHPYGLISPHDLAVALEMGTDGGLNPLTVLDLVHCFSASIEQFYELHRYAHALTGSPNYTYASPIMLGQGLSSIQAGTEAAVMADTLVRTYTQSIPDAGHPRILVAVHGSRLPPIKQAWDTMAYYLKAELLARPRMSRVKISSAYQASAKYDTTFCEPQDWQLTSPDALTDMADFAHKLALRFGRTSQIGRWADETAQLIKHAVIARYAHQGRPWFAGSSSQPIWTFDGAGVALYTDFQPLSASGQTVYLSPQSMWYTDTVSAINPHPYQFVQGGIHSISWADVFDTFWQGQTIAPAPCLLPRFPQAQNEGELSVMQITSPITQFGVVSVDVPITLAAAIETQTVVDNPLVQFQVSHHETVVFSDTVSAGYLMTGTHEIKASRAWSPTVNGPFTLVVTVDSDDRVLETDELDNRQALTAEILPKQARPVIQGRMQQGWQWVSQRNLWLELNQPDRQATPVETLLVQGYQYQAGLTPRARLPSKVYEQTLPQPVPPNGLVALTLPPLINPGPITLIIWGISAKQAMSVAPVVIQFNYAPENRILQAGQSQYFLVDAQAGERFEFELSVAANQDANLFAWLPFQFTVPTWRAVQWGNDRLVINPIPFDGQYLISLRSETTTNYRLQVKRNGQLEGQLPPSTIYLPLVREGR